MEVLPRNYKNILPRGRSLIKKLSKLCQEVKVYPKINGGFVKNVDV
jgi:hypothetical protein